jgi:hypothetical protein
LEVERIHHDRPQPGCPRTDHVDPGHVAHVPRVGGCNADRVEGDLEDPGIGLGNADGTGVDDARDLHAEPGADLQHLLRGQPLRDGAVGIRDDADVHTGCDERAQSVDRTGNDA